MKILWVVNTVFPEPSKALGFQIPNIGGWMYGFANQVSRTEGLFLAVATTYSGNDFKHLYLNGIDYFLLPCKNMLIYNEYLEDYWEKVCDIFIPNIIHINGTESPIGLACIRKFPNLNYIISIQGLVSVISRYFKSGISNFEILKNLTIRNIFKNDSIFQLQKQFYRRGKFEEEYIKTCQYFIGRTQWDYAHIKSINSNSKYFFCNESLRDIFYSAKKWNRNYCERHTIFLSQSHSPIKGLHQVIKAIKLLISDFPDIKIKVGGSNVTKSNNFNEKMKLSNYGKFIRKLIKDLCLENYVEFLGNLDESQMVCSFQNAHVFVCSSSIENSSNSVGEAQLLGVPTIASYVGGMSDLIEHKKTGLLYRFEEVEMLADNIRIIFNNDSFANILSINAIQAASQRHNREVNLHQLLSIYQEIKCTP
jgi:glycosyltransferase involved in cell wall biosynthesis